MPVLNREDKTLWLLLTFPESLTSILLKKVAVWAALGLLYGGAALALLSKFGHRLHAAWGEAFFALYGVGLYAFIASGIGVLATDATLDAHVIGLSLAEVGALHNIGQLALLEHFLMRSGKLF